VIRFTDAPYRFQPSQYDPLMSLAIAVWIRCYHLPVKVNVRRVHVAPARRAHRRFGRSDRVLVLANHTSLTDGSVMVDVLRRRGLHPCFLSTFEMFLRPGLIRWSLRHLGAMSIQPYGSDFQGMQEAIRVLTRPARGRLKPSLCVFPEGVIHREMDRVGEFEEGAFALAVRAAAELPNGLRLHVQPVSVHVSHTDPEGTRPRLIERMAEIESRLDLRTRPEHGLSRRVIRAGRAYLAQSARELGVEPTHRDVRRGLEEVRKEGVRALLEELEPPRRRRPCRSKAVDRAIGLFYQRNREGLLEHGRGARWARRLAVLKRLERFDPAHLNRTLTFNQMAGLLETFMEDLTGTLLLPLGPREVFVAFEEPVCVSEGTGSVAPSELIGRTRARVTESINARLRAWHEARVSPGDQAWVD
jgi:1-acyl-sn-glycerol-3-phosphate acyltransferase